MLGLFPLPLGPFDPTTEDETMDAKGEPGPSLEVIVNTAKDEIRSLLQKLPDDCTLEDVQYHLYVLGKIRRGIERAESEGAVSQEEVERRLTKWTSKWPGRPNHRRCGIDRGLHRRGFGVSCPSGRDEDYRDGAEH